MQASVGGDSTVGGPDLSKTKIDERRRRTLTVCFESKNDFCLEAIVDQAITLVFARAWVVVVHVGTRRTRGNVTS